MKKLLVLCLTVLLSFPLLSQEPERGLSDYEKYRMEKEAEEYPEEEICWNIVEEMPKFNGGAPSEFKKWISLNVEYPKQAREERIHGKVFVKFVVNKYGDVVNVEVPESIDPILDAEAIRVVQSSPKWTPGFQHGSPVNVEFTFPIKFVLRDDTPEGPAMVNNYYNYDYDYGFRSRLYFDTWYYRPYSYYSYYDPYYYGYGYNPYYYGSYYPYWGYNTYYNPYYYPHSHYTYYNRSYGREYARSSSLGSNRSYYSPYNKTYRNGYVNPPTAMKKNVTTRPQTTTRSKSTYTPTYTKPRMDTRPKYNTTRRTTTVTSPRSESRSVQSTKSNYNRPSTSSRSTYSRPSTPSRSSSSYSRSSAPVRSYSTPSRSSSSSSYSRPSSSSSSGRSYSSGSASRSSSSRSGGKK